MSVALVGHSIATVAELRSEVSRPTGNDDQIHSALNRSTAFIEQHTGRMWVKRGTITEYHSPRFLGTELVLSEWPIISITSVHENVDRVYDAAHLLSENTDFITDTARGRLERMEVTGSGVINSRTWDVGREAIKVLYIAGYATAEAVPWDVKDVAIRLAGRLFKASERGHYGVASLTDAVGTLTRFAPEWLTKDMLATLNGHRRFAGGTWGRKSVA